jgi:hypothetical protein
MSAEGGWSAKSVRLVQLQLGTLKYFANFKNFCYNIFRKNEIEMPKNLINWLQTMLRKNFASEGLVLQGQNKE